MVEQGSPSELGAGFLVTCPPRGLCLSRGLGNGKEEGREVLRIMWGGTESICGVSLSGVLAACLTSDPAGKLCPRLRLLHSNESGRVD